VTIVHKKNEVWRSLMVGAIGGFSGILQGTGESENHPGNPVFWQAGPGFDFQRQR